jgi:hypothetical protein
MSVVEMFDIVVVDKPATWLGVSELMNDTIGNPLPELLAHTLIRRSPAIHRQISQIEF